MPINLDRFMAQTWAQKSGKASDLMAVILAAGLGKRMDPLTAHHLPKPMFPLGGAVPIAETWVRKCVASGIADISMNLCVLANTIHEYFQDGARFGARIGYVEEEDPSGTLGGVCKQVLTCAQSEPDAKQRPKSKPSRFEGSNVLVVSGDIVTNFSPEALGRMYEVHRAKGAAVTIALSPVPWEMRRHFGTAELFNPENQGGLLSRSGRIIQFREKDPDSPSNLNNASIYMIERAFIEELDALRTEASLDLKEPFYDFGKHVFPAMLGGLDYAKLSREALLWGVQYDGLWFDVGRKRDYLSVNARLLDGDVEVSLPYERLPWGYLGHNVTIDFRRVTIHPPVVIGNDCIIEPGATLGPYAVVGDGWTVSRGAHLRNSVLWQRYDYFADDGRRITAAERKLVDRHEVRGPVSIDGSIIVGGSIVTDFKEKAVDVLEDGQIEILPIDWVPSGERA